MDKFNASELLTVNGGSLKMVGVDEYRGPLVLFSSPDDPDLTGDYFTEKTDYGDSVKTAVLWAHSMDPDIGDIEFEPAELKRDKIAVWMEGVVKVREKYKEMLRERFGRKDAPELVETFVKSMIAEGELGLSSGTLPNRVERTAIKSADGNIQAYEIKRWILGLDGSFVPNPAEPRTDRLSLKEYIKMASDGAQPEATKAEDGQGDPSPVAAPAQSDAMTDADASKTATTEAKHTEGQTMAGEQKEVKAEAKSAQDNVMLDELKELIRKQNERMDAMQKEFKETATTTGIPEIKGAPAYVKERGDSQAQAFAHWVKTGDKGAVRDMLGVDETGREVVEIKASNATDMNIGTAADGGNTVTDDMFTNIIRRADEKSLSARAGVRRFTSRGTTLDIPLDNEADSEFVAANEAAQFDEDAPAIGQTSLTKVKYTKRTLVSYELMQDAHVTDLMEYIMDRVAMGKAKTDNDLLISAVESGGTEFDVFAGTAAIAVDELENLAINDTNAWYVENPADAKWIMRPSTHRAISILDDTSIRRYNTNQQGEGRSLFGSEILYSNKVDAIGSGLKPVLFGNFNYVAQLEDPTLQFLRDPYTRADYGQVRLLWYYRTAFKVLQAAAVGYGRNITT